MQKTFLLLMLITLLVCPFVFGQSRKSKNTASLSNQDNQNQTVKSPTQTPSSIIQPTIEEAKNVEPKPSDENSDKVFWDKWSSIGTLASAVTSIIVLVVVVIQALFNKKQVKISNDQLAQMEAQVIVMKDTLIDTQKIIAQNERAIKTSESQAIIAENALEHAKDVFNESVRHTQFAQNRKIKSVIVGLQTEIKTLLEIYEDEFKTEIEAMNQGEPFKHIYPISNDYFTLYTANASLIGEIPDDELRTLIVKMYLKGRSIIDSHTFNNTLIEELAEIDKQRAHYHYNGEIEASFNIAEAAMNDYGINVKVNYLELVELINTLEQRVPEVLATLPSE